MITYIDSLLNMTNMTGGPFAGRRHGRGQGLSSYLPDQRGTRPSKTGTATRGGDSSYLSCINQSNIIRMQWNQLDKFEAREDEKQVVDINQLRHLH
jgi:hypothetical protein